MLGYDSINSTLQSMVVREKIRTFLINYFLLVFPVLKFIDSKEIDLLIDVYIEIFKESVGVTVEDEEKKMIKYYLAALFDKKPDYNFNTDPEIIKKDAKDYFRIIFKEVFEEFQKIFGAFSEEKAKTENTSVKSFVKNLEILNTPSIFLTNIPINKEKTLKVFNSEQRLDWKTFFKKRKSVSSQEFLEQPEKFYIETYFVGDPKKDTERFLSFQEAYKRKRENPDDFKVSAVGVRLMMSISKNEVFSNPFFTKIYREYAASDAAIFPNESSQNQTGITHIRVGNNIFGFKIKEFDFSQKIVHGLLPPNFNPSPLRAATIFKAYAPIFNGEGGQYRLYNIPIFFEDTKSGYKIENLSIDEHFGELVKLFNLLKDKEDDNIGGVIGDVIDKTVAANKQILLSELIAKDNIFNTTREQLVNTLSEKKDVNEFFVEEVPIATLLSVLPIYYGAILKKETTLLKDLADLGDELAINRYSKSVDKLLEELTKFDEYT